MYQIPKILMTGKQRMSKKYETTLAYIESEHHLLSYYERASLKEFIDDKTTEFAKQHRDSWIAQTPSSEELGDEFMKRIPNDEQHLYIHVKDYLRKEMKYPRTDPNDEIAKFLKPYILGKSRRYQPKRTISPTEIPKLAENFVENTRQYRQAVNPNNSKLLDEKYIEALKSPDFVSFNSSVDRNSNPFSKELREIGSLFDEKKPSAPTIPELLDGGTKFTRQELLDSGYVHPTYQELEINEKKPSAPTIQELLDSGTKFTRKELLDSGYVPTYQELEINEKKPSTLFLDQSVGDDRNSGETIYARVGDDRNSGETASSVRTNMSRVSSEITSSVPIDTLPEAPTGPILPKAPTGPILPKASTGSIDDMYTLEKGVRF